MAITLLLGSIALTANAGEGKAAKFSGFVKCVRLHSNYAVNADGTHTETHEVIVEVLTEKGIESANQAYVNYSESMEQVEILSAYTLKKDGRRIDVPSSNIQERATVAEGGPMFSDIKTKVIVFPDVAIGDKVGYFYRLVQKTALFPGHFSLTVAFAKFVVHEDVRIHVSVPINSLELRVFSRGVDGGPMPDKDGRKQWAWSWRNRETATPEYGSVGPLDYGPSIIVSSFKDYGALATAYEERARPKSAVTDKVRKLAEELTRGMGSPREQAKALYTWVSRNIHYAGNSFGVGSVVPHDVDTVLANRLGDCKDHTALFQSLLAARGIESTPALINAGGATFTFPEAPSVGVFDHVIAYIPSLDLYADPTSQYTPFGRLPVNEASKPVIPTTNFTSVRKTPSPDYQTNRSHTKMTLHIHKDGSADGETWIEENGFFASNVQAGMAQIKPNMEDQLIRGILTGSGYTGTGTLIKADPNVSSDRYTYGSKYHLDNAINLPGAGGIYILPILRSAGTIGSVVSGVNIPERTLNYICFGGISIEEHTIELPPNITILSIPRNLHIAGKTTQYDATYQRKDNTITAVRKITDQNPKIPCTPENDKEFRPLGRAILKDLQAQILYQDH